MGSRALGLLDCLGCQKLVRKRGMALITGLLGQLLDEQNVALGDLVLLPAGLDDCMHCDCTSFLDYGLAVGGEGGGENLPAYLQPIQSGSEIITAGRGNVKPFSPPGGTSIRKISKIRISHRKPSFDISSGCRILEIRKGESKWETAGV